ncbi:sensor histidine kinase [Paenibacillus thalictri]|uniref:histidine kinase n=1 Tax=Paenibacillus thalictri TaxID=2527873 RepID=A0A4Q9DWT0_9BACL|nr:ATP-binding protein [Paenibacillus thalictri]TBL81554.1 hypothetical protein EYB31_00635 [Paenibacillus thalictri]
MKKWIWLTVGLCLLMLSACLPVFAAETRTMPMAAEGVLNASYWDFKEQGTIHLNGDWQFYWNAFLEPADFKEDSSKVLPQGSMMSVPRVWGGTNNPASNQEGYATYRLRIMLDAAEQDTIKALYIPAAASAYKLWINGKQLDGNGVVGTDRDSMKPKNYAKVVYFEANGGMNEIVIQVSNFVQRKGGLWSPLTFGNSADIMLLREKNMAVQGFVAIAMLTLGFYHLSLVSFRKYNTLDLAVGVTCILLALRTLLLGDTLLVRFWPEFDWELAVKIEYLAPYFGIPYFSWYVLNLYPRDVNRRLIYCFLAVGGLFSLSVIVLPVHFFTQTLFAFQLFTIFEFVYLCYVFLKATVLGREGAWLNGIGGIVMNIAIMNDVLYYNNYIQSIDFSAYGVMVFLFTQTVVVALKYSNAYYKVESVSRELVEVNLTLEDKIRERTEALEQMNRQLRDANSHMKQIESSRRQIIANISHELGTPMTAVQGYLKALLDGIIRPQDDKYIGMIYDKVIMVNRLIQDLFDLSKLETGKASFQMAEVAAEELFERYFREFQYDVEKKDIQFEMTHISGLPDNRLVLLLIDPLRIQQVVGNLVYNAIKFTMAGGLIRITGEFSMENSAEKGELTVSVSDTGVGMEQDELPHVFDRFYKNASTSHYNAGGSGLGLAIAKEIIAYHGGQLTVESEPLKGSTFRFTLPAELLKLEVD